MSIVLMVIVIIVIVIIVIAIMIPYLRDQELAKLKILDNFRQRSRRCQRHRHLWKCNPMAVCGICYYYMIISISAIVSTITLYILIIIMYE